MDGKGQKTYPKLGTGTFSRGRSTFLTRTAQDDTSKLFRRSSIPAPLFGGQSHITREEASTPSHTSPPGSIASPQQPTFFQNLFGGNHDGASDRNSTQNQFHSLDAPWVRRLSGHFMQNGSSAEAPQTKPQAEIKGPTTKVGGLPRPVGGDEKLDTFSGVFVPTSLNVLSILMFIRFGFILGQSGVIGMLVMLAVAYLINLVTTMSISAVASNGTVRGGGAYYLISRSLGPEFGGAIGLVSYLGFVFNTGMNAVGLIDCLNYNFGTESGNWANTLPEGAWWQYLWSTIVVVLCVVICLAGSAIFARASNGLLLILLIATLSIPFSSIVLQPFENTKQFIEFTGLRVQTLRENLFPQFTRGAAGSQLKTRENYQDLFGILFPATGGILAGASMSGDLKNPSKSIPRGTLAGLALTFISYALVIVAMGASITRESFYRNVNVVQDSNISGVLILAGEIATTFFSVLMGIIGPAKQLQAIARDGVFPGLSIFGQGTEKHDEPTYAILCTFLVAQLTLLLDINKIASLITMTYLMTFFALNVATFLLKIGSAPNFRPSFRYFNWWTAAAGAIISVVSMFFVDGLSASGSVCILLVLIILIHYTTPPKPWGSISEVLIYHQVRKYLLRLRNEHVKFWRPQILLFVNDPRRGYKLIQFCNSLKKGSLFILGHVLVTQNFGASVPEARRQQAAWTKYIDFSKIKAFVNVAISPSIEWGARNIVLSAGLGSMRPNIVIFGFYNLQQFRSEQPLVDVPSPPPERKRGDDLRKRRKSRNAVEGELPTDICVIEKRTDIQSYVMVLEDMILKLQTNVAIAAGFSELELPNPKEGNTKKYIDLWPIQMSAEVSSDAEGRRVLTTNFDTYTLILQLGCILNTVPSWKKTHKLRVAVFVEYESDVDEERARVTALLENLRIQAEVLVFWLASGDIKSYQLIVNGEDIDAESEAQVDKVLEDELWWKDLQQLRGKGKQGEVSNEDDPVLSEDITWQPSAFQNKRNPSLVQFKGLRKLLKYPRKRSSFGNLSSLGVSLNMRTSRLDDDMLSRHASHPSDSEYSDEEHSDSADAASEDSEPYSDDDANDHILDDEFTDEPEAAQFSPTEIRPKSSSSKKSSRASSRRSRASKKRRVLEEGEASNSPLMDPNTEPLIDFEENVLNEESTRGRNAGRGDSISASPGLAPGLISQQRSRAPSPNFSSEPVPVAKVESQEDAGPSIMFAEDPHPRHQRNSDIGLSDTNLRSIYRRTSGSSPPKAGGFPAVASLSLSFNDLPCRAQHLILNELISLNSEDTAVVFTTLPAPEEGTYKSESDSLTYVSDLEVLCGGLPPTLLVHSNSMTVTMNL